MKTLNKISEKMVIQADRIYFEELITNLLTNTIKYTPYGGTVILNAKKRKDSVTISIKDSGIGMTREQIHLMFDEFYKADESRHELNSSGLGLSICKKIVERHGGKIWAESPGLGKGTTIHFTLKSNHES